eukprot:SAG22_NODE_8600_length_642_cov_1.022099_1_plen_67_part_01
MSSSCHCTNQGVLIVAGFTFFYESPLEKVAAMVGCLSAVMTTYFAHEGIRLENKLFMVGVVQPALQV